MIMAAGSCGLKDYEADWVLSQGTLELYGHDTLIREVCNQIDHKRGLVKVYIDFRWGTTRLG